jgi:hypothetical protein
MAMKKPKPKKCKCDLPAGTSASSLSMLMGAARTSSPEESAMHREMDKVRLDMMKADLRRQVAEADLAEVTAARARAELQQYLAALAKKAVRK